jgi:hypothetical protein
LEAEPGGIMSSSPAELQSKSLFQKQTKRKKEKKKQTKNNK